MDAALALGITASVKRFCAESYCTLPTAPLVAVAVGAEGAYPLRVTELSPLAKTTETESVPSSDQSRIRFLPVDASLSFSPRKAISNRGAGRRGAVGARCSRDLRAEAGVRRRAGETGRRLGGAERRVPSFSEPDGAASRGVHWSSNGPDHAQGCAHKRRGVGVAAHERAVDGVRRAGSGTPEWHPRQPAWRRARVLLRAV